MSKPKGTQSKKTKEYNADFDYYEKSDFSEIDPALKEELAEKNLAYRWINAKSYMENYGFHKTNWKAYKRDIDSDKPRGSLDFNMGTDAEGYVRFGDLVLAVKPLEAQRRHSAKIKERTDRLNQVQTKAAEDIRESARRGNLSEVDVYEGYDENS